MTPSRVPPSVLPPSSGLAPPRLPPSFPTTCGNTRKIRRPRANARPMAGHTSRRPLYGVPPPIFWTAARTSSSSAATATRKLQRGRKQKRGHWRRSSVNVFFLHGEGCRGGFLLASGLVSETVGMRRPTLRSRFKKGFSVTIDSLCGGQQKNKGGRKHWTIRNGTMWNIACFLVVFDLSGLRSRPATLGPFLGDVWHAGVYRDHRGRSTVLCGAGAL